MARIPYYFEATGAYPTLSATVVNGVLVKAGDETLDGAIQEYLDGVHLALTRTVGMNAVPLDGVLAEQTTLPVVTADITAMSRARFYQGAALQGQNPDDIAAKYIDAAKKLFACYGVTA